MLVEEDDGRKVVVTYRTWKYKYKPYEKGVVVADQYRGVIGIVQFPPREGEAKGKPVRNIRVNSFGFGPYAVAVDATLWPSHGDIEVAENDLVALEGKYSKNEKDGKTYHNISVTRFKNLGAVETGTKPDVDDNGTGDDPADDDIPF